MAVVNHIDKNYNYTGYKIPDGARGCENVEEKRHRFRTYPIQDCAEAVEKP